MTDLDLTHLTLVIDRSGSMTTLKSDMEPAIQRLLDEQEAMPGKLLIDVVTFDSLVEFPFTDASRWRVCAPLIHPRGGTALIDAVGMTINRLGERLASQPESARPGTVIVAVVTDGMENSSREFTRAQVKAMVRHQEETYGWTFTFLGANIDAVSVGAGLGVPKGASITYDPTRDGVQYSFNAASAAMSTVRSGGVYAYTEADREKAHAGSAPNAPQEEVVDASAVKTPRWRKRR